MYDVREAYAHGAKNMHKLLGGLVLKEVAAIDSDCLITCDLQLTLRDEGYANQYPGVRVFKCSTSRAFGTNQK